MPPLALDSTTEECILLPHRHSFPGDGAKLDFTCVAGEPALQDLALFGGVTAVPVSSSPPAFIERRASCIPELTTPQARSYVLSRSYTMPSLENENLVIKPLEHARADVAAPPFAIDAKTGRLTVFNASPLLPGDIHSRFLNDRRLALLPHCVDIDVRTARRGPYVTPESFLSPATRPDDIAYSSDVPSRYLMDISLKPGGVIDAIQYCDISAFVKRPHCLGAVENAKPSLQKPSGWGKPPKQWVFVGGELMPGSPTADGHVLGVVIFDFTEKKLRHTIALSLDVQGDMVSSIEPALRPDTILVTLRYGGVYIIQNGVPAQHIAPPSRQQAGLTWCRSLTPEFLIARSFVGRLMHKAPFSDWAGPVHKGVKAYDGCIAIGLLPAHLLVGEKLSDFHADRFHRYSSEDAVRSGEIPQCASHEEIPATLHRYAECSGEFYFPEESNKLGRYVKREKRYTQLLGTIGGEVVAASFVPGRALVPSVIRSPVLRVRGARETATGDRDVSIAVANRVDERHKRDTVGLDAHPTMGEVEGVCIASVRCHPSPRKGEDIVLVTTVSGLLMLFSLEITPAVYKRPLCGAAHAAQKKKEAAKKASAHVIVDSDADGEEDGMLEALLNNVA